MRRMCHMGGLQRRWCARGGLGTVCSLSGCVHSCRLLHSLLGATACWRRQTILNSVVALIAFAVDAAVHPRLRAGMQSC